MSGFAQILRVIAAAGLMSMASALSAADMGSALPLARDLAADGARAAVAGAPVLVFYVSQGCPYCRQVEELYLEPMQQRRPYGDRLLIRVVQIDSHRALTDFTGRDTDHATFARREGATFTPWVQLYGRDGAPLAAPLIGYTSPDFYAGQLETRIDEAIARQRPATAAR